MKFDETYKSIQEICAEAKFHDLAVYDVFFNSCEPDPKLQLFLDYSDYEFEINFTEVVHHSVMSESYVYYREEDDWECDTFISEARKSKLIKLLGEYTILSSTYMDDLMDLKHYRVCAQNFFVEVITTEKPTFKIKKEKS